MSSDGHRRHRVLLGGGIGAGKSAIATLFVDAGFIHVQSDRVGAEVLRPGTLATEAVAQEWPGVVHDGVVDRAALAVIVFSSKSELHRLESITHPQIRVEIDRIAREANGSVVVEVPLTTMSLCGEWTRVAVLADEETRMDRAVARGGEPEDVRRRIRSQVSEDEWVAWADIVVTNDDAWAETSHAVTAIIDGLKNE